MGAGINLDGGYGHVAGAHLRTEAGKKSGKTKSYEALPAKELLVASGTIQRGTGVYYKFNASSQTTLEGSHELTVQFRVPGSWRGGLIRIDCLARGKRQYLGGIEDDVVAGKSEFVTALYLKGDAKAREIAIEFAHQERNLDQLGRHWQRKNRERSSHWLKKLEWAVGESEREGPETYLNQIRLNSSDQIAKVAQRQLDPPLRAAAADFPRRPAKNQPIGPIGNSPGAPLARGAISRFLAGCLLHSNLELLQSTFLVWGDAVQRLAVSSLRKEVFFGIGSNG